MSSFERGRAGALRPRRSFQLWYPRAPCWRGQGGRRKSCPNRCPAACQALPQALTGRHTKPCMAVPVVIHPCFLWREWVLRKELPGPMLTPLSGWAQMPNDIYLTRKPGHLSTENALVFSKRSTSGFVSSSSFPPLPHLLVCLSALHPSSPSRNLAHALVCVWGFAPLFLVLRWKMPFLVLNPCHVCWQLGALSVAALVLINAHELGAQDLPIIVDERIKTRKCCCGSHTILSHSHLAFIL